MEGEGTVGTFLHSKQAAWENKTCFPVADQDKKASI